MTQIQYNKLFGQEFDGVLLQFFVSHVDECTVGDKISAQVALKGVISQVLGDDQRPYTEGDKEDPIDLIVSPMSVVSRMTVDLFFNLYANKVLVELKKKCKKIWNN
jgi:DNA-directed RNA polymerase beta subunit